jgi:hypothetical protein
VFVIPLAVLFEYSVNAFHQPLMVGYIGQAGEGIRTIGKQRHEAGAIRFTRSATAWSHSAVSAGHAARRDF